MNKLFLFFFILLLSSCEQETPEQIGLQHNKLMKAVFNKYQIEDFEKIMTFFEGEICSSQQLPSDSAMDCYKAYLHELTKTNGTGNLSLDISLEDQDSLLQNLYGVTYIAVWSDGKTIESNSTNGLFGLKYGGQYQRFLKKLGEENEKIKQYESTFDLSGIITPSMIADMLVNYADYDLSDERVRLVIAIHYLTLNKTFAEAIDQID